jgi:hypothetical protein
LASLRDELPPEGDEAEAREVVSRHPIRLPTYKLERVHVATLNVAYAPPHGQGYARPLSPYRVRQLRRDWDPLAVGPLVVSRRADNSLWLIDGNHRRYVGYEKGMLQMPAMVHSGLEPWQEADLYTKLGTVLGQTPWTRFLAKLAAGDDAAREIVKIASRYGFTVNGERGLSDHTIQAVARVEWIHARSGPEGLNWVLAFLDHAFAGERDAIGELQLEGTFQFYARYADKANRDEIATIVGGSGVNAWYDRAASIQQRIDVGNRANTFGLALAEIVNDAWRRKGKRIKELLPTWEHIGQFGSRYRDVSFSDRAVQWRTSQSDLVPQQLGATS